MVAYSFQRQFLAPIRALTKQQTIRSARKRHARPGEDLQLYFGMRTKHCSLIGSATCTGVEPVRLCFAKLGDQLGVRPLVELPAQAAVLRYPEQLNQFARKDGFEDWLALHNFWHAHHDGCEQFDGILISWTSFKEKT